jgi:hypothetical protein
MTFSLPKLAASFSLSRGKTHTHRRKKSLKCTASTERTSTTWKKIINSNNEFTSTFSERSRRWRDQIQSWESRSCDEREWKGESTARKGERGREETNKIRHFASTQADDATPSIREQSTPFFSSSPALQNPAPILGHPPQCEMLADVSTQAKSNDPPRAATGQRVKPIGQEEPPGMATR